MANPYPKKSYVYRCKCGKDPMRGFVQTDPATERQLFDILDLAWAKSHNIPGCTLASKTVKPAGKASQCTLLLENGSVCEQSKRLLDTKYNLVV